MDILLTTGIALVIGAGAFFIGRYLKTAEIQESAEKAKKILSQAETQKKELLLEAKDQALQIRNEVEKEEKRRRFELQKIEKRLEGKEEHCDRRQEMLEKKFLEIEKRSEQIAFKEREVEVFMKQAQEKLQTISGLTSEQAKELLLEEIEKDVKQEAVRLIKEVEEATKEEADKKSREILVRAMQRMATDVTSDATVYAISLPSDEMKGRVIGREGRNIRTLEQLTGVTFTVDDTPETIIISCFDPIRREVARITLERLVKDGRIHPARIEEMVDKSKKEVAKEIKEAGEQALVQTGVAGVPTELLKLVGRLKFRTSYGQNVLKHSIEVAHIAGLLAGELKDNVTSAKRAGLLHDIGKAVDHEVEGPHSLIGKDILERFDFPPDIVHAVGAHHEDLELESTLDFIVQIADAISASRPGARWDTKEQFIQRVNEIENLANNFEGVKKSYAIQAGREVRVLVNPTEIDDLANIRLARDIAKKIEETLKYPGQIKVVAIRETRATELAK